MQLSIIKLEGTIHTASGTTQLSQIHLNILQAVHWGHYQGINSGSAEGLYKWLCESGVVSTSAYSWSWKSEMRGW